jgi:hypothetical protein
MILTALLIVAVSGLAIIVRELRKAPEGYEDEHGFHVIGKMPVETSERATRTQVRHGQTQPATAH